MVAENSAFKYIKNNNNNKKYYCFYCIFDQIKTALVRIYFKKKNLTNSKYLDSSVCS